MQPYNNTKHTARYQLSRFLQSEDSFKLPLTDSDIAILSIIFDFMDSGENEECFADQTKLSKISRVPKRTLIRRIKVLVENNLIVKKRIGYKNYYYIGETIKKYVPNRSIVSAKPAKSKCQGGTLYKNIDNNIYNNVIPIQPTEYKGFAKTAKNPSPLLEMVIANKK